jgi:hypothetical protein
MGCGCRRDEGQGKKTEVARGGWAEDARRPSATSFVSVVIPRLIECLVRSRGTWGRGRACDTRALRKPSRESSQDGVSRSLAGFTRSACASATMFMIAIFCSPRFFPPPFTELVEINDRPNPRAWHPFEDSPLFHRSSFLDFGGRPAPDSFDHFLNVSVS